MASQVSAVAGQPASDEKGSKSTDGADAGKALTLDAAAAAGQAQGPQAGAAHRATNLPAPQPPEVQFADSNHEPIVTGVKAQLLPHGGSMQIRLDPPELGALKVMVEMRDGAMTATFQTSNEEATRLLSHSLNQLKHVLEGQGVNVERLQVQQAPKGDSASGGGGDDPKQQQNPQNWQDEHAARQEQQRKEVLRRMWRRVSGMTDPIDVTA
jgi:flagellar hook-length control protein FliK